MEEEKDTPAKNEAVEDGNHWKEQIREQSTGYYPAADCINDKNELNLVSHFEF